MRWVTGGALIVGLLLGAQTTGGEAAIEPLVVGWERFLSLDWEVAEGRSGPVVRGYITNSSPYTLTRLQLLADVLDNSGRVVAQQVAWGPDVLGAFDRRYFEVRLKDRGPAYRMRVLAFDRLEAAAHQAP